MGQVDAATVYEANISQYSGLTLTPLTFYYLDEKKIRRVRTILGVKTETEAIDAALNLVVFRKEILKSLEKVAGKGGVEKVI